MSGSQQLHGCTPGCPVLHYVPEFVQTHVHWVGDAVEPLYSLSPSSPALNLSQHQGLFQWVASQHQLPEYWSYNFSINPSNENSGLVSFRIDWFDPFVAQGTLKNLPSTIWKHQFFSAQPSLWSNSAPLWGTIKAICTQ